VGSAPGAAGGTLGVDYWARQVLAILSSAPWEAWIAPTGPLDLELGELAGLVEEKLRSMHKIEASLRGARSHGELMLMALEAALKSLEPSDGISKIVARALDILRGRDGGRKQYGIVSECRRLASTFETLAAQHIDKAVKAILGPSFGFQAAARGRRAFRVRNIFQPSLEYEPASSDVDRLTPERLASYVARTVAAAAGLALRLHVEGGLEAGPSLVHALLLALEEEWYEELGRIIPPGDPRVPTYSFFDYIYAVAMVCGILHPDQSGVALQGRLLIADLGGIQDYIAESRRLRDYWASSWLGSALLWASIRPLLERYGPGVAVSPPVRLHSFYTAWLAGLAGLNPDSCDGLERSGAEEWQRLLCSALARANGPERWPVHATVPSRALLILPPPVGTSSYSGLVTQSYNDAWNSIRVRLSRIVREYYRRAAEILSKTESEESKGESGSGQSPGHPTPRDLYLYSVMLLALAEDLSGEERVDLSRRLFGRYYTSCSSSNGDSETKKCLCNLINTIGNLVNTIRESLKEQPESQKNYKYDCSKSLDNLRELFENDNLRELFENLLRDLAGLSRKFRRALEGIEPPLPLRVVEEDLGGDEFRGSYELFFDSVASEALRIAESREDLEPRIRGIVRAALSGFSQDRLSLAYAFATGVWAPRVESRIRVRVNPRAAGPNAFRLSRMLHAIYTWSRLEARGLQQEGEARSVEANVYCTVCGRNLAIVDTSLHARLLRLGASSEWGGDGGGALGLIARETSSHTSERLCPYCLAKRLTRRLLVGEGPAGVAGQGSLAKELVGVEASRKARETLAGGSVVHYTSALRLNLARFYKQLDDLKELCKRLKGRVERAIELLEQLGVPVRANSFRNIIPPEELRHRGNSAQVLGEKCLELLEVLYLEILSDRTIAERIQRILESTEGLEELGEVVRRIERLASRVREARVYSILVSDGDLIGSGVHRGILSLPPRRYYTLALSGTIEDRIIAEVAVETYTTIAEAVGRVLAKAGVERAGELTVVLTPSYHFTVSRALAAIAQLDRVAASEHGSFIVYAGGDDLQAVVPPARFVEGKVEATALRLAADVRNNYWGTIVDGFVEYEGAVVPAMRAYGRSTAVYYTRVKTPMWAAIRSAHRLLESKDGTSRVLLPGFPGEKPIEEPKDVGFAAYEYGRDPAILPISLPGTPGQLAGSLELAARIAESNLDRRSAVPTSALYKPLREESRIRGLLEDGYPWLALRLAEYLVTAGGETRGAGRVIEPFSRLYLARLAVRTDDGRVRPLAVEAFLAAVATRAAVSGGE